MMKARMTFAALLLFAAAAVVAAVVDQPMMRAARVDLQTARRELQQATADKGGHRVNALSLVSRAIDEINAGIAYDRRHNHANTFTVDNVFGATPDQPHMERAKTALQSAKNNLERATADKGGHRARALDLVRQAIDEVNKGIEAGRG